MLCEKFLDIWKIYTHILRITCELYILKKSCLDLKNKFGSRKYRWRERSLYEQYNWNCTNNWKVNYNEIQHLQYFDLFLAGGLLQCWLTGLLGVVKWRGVGIFLLGTSVWQGQLYLRRLRKDTRRNISLQWWLASSLPLDNCNCQRPCSPL